MGAPTMNNVEVVEAGVKFLARGGCGNTVHGGWRACRNHSLPIAPHKREIVQSLRIAR